MTQNTVNALPTSIPLVTQFFLSMCRHDKAEELHDDEALAREDALISAIETEAASRPPTVNTPDIFFRICVARGRLGELYSDAACGHDIGPLVDEIEALLDAAMAGISVMTTFDPAAWRLDYYTPAAEPKWEAA